MTKIELFYVGKFQPNMIVSVNHWLVDGLLESGQYILASEMKKKKPKKEKVELEEEIENSEETISDSE